jgi:uncharacterized protein with von Willebrand factor type A (vWA) domain
VSTLRTYAYPIFKKRPVAEIDVHLVLKVLKPIWNDKNETASRVRGRIERVLDWARVKQYRLGDNPAVWHGHLEFLLPKSSKVASVTVFAWNKPKPVFDRTQLRLWPLRSRKLSADTHGAMFDARQSLRKSAATL